MHIYRLNIRLHSNIPPSNSRWLTKWELVDHLEFVSKSGELQWGERFVRMLAFWWAAGIWWTVKFLFRTLLRTKNMLSFMCFVLAWSTRLCVIEYYVLYYLRYYINLFSFVCSEFASVCLAVIGWIAFASRLFYQWLVLQAYIVLV